MHKFPFLMYDLNFTYINIEKKCCGTAVGDGEGGGILFFRGLKFAEKVCGNSVCVISSAA